MKSWSKKALSRQPLQPGANKLLRRKQHREALKQLIDFGVMDWPEEVLDNVILGSEQFAPWIHSGRINQIKAHHISQLSNFPCIVAIHHAKMASEFVELSQAFI